MTNENSDDKSHVHVGASKEGLTSVHSRTPARSFGYLIVKRTMDVLGSCTGLVLLSPLLAGISVLIMLLEGRPILLVQTKVGKYGRHLKLYKFQTIRRPPDKERLHLDETHSHENTITYKLFNDPRITPVGNFLRRSGMDGLPQLWNVLMGDMSLVGPQAAFPEEVAGYTREEARRLDVKPGLTCIRQVSGRGNLPFADRIQLDLQYVDRPSIWLDLVLLLRTIPAVLIDRGAL